jgi:hypothetical protein
VLSADTDSENNKETFFGDFLPLSKKLPAACGGSFCSKSHQKKSRWIPAFAGMTSSLSKSDPPLAAEASNQNLQPIPD